MLQDKGFTLLEMLFTVAIVGILAGLAITNYQQHLLKVHRQAGKTALLALANRLERYHTRHGTYQGAELNTAADYYRLHSQVSNNEYLIQAIPQGKQQADKHCATLQLNHLGQKTVTGTGSNAFCWAS